MADICKKFAKSLEEFLTTMGQMELSMRESFLNVFELFFTSKLCVDCAPNICVRVVERW